LCKYGEEKVNAKHIILKGAFSTSGEGRERWRYQCSQRKVKFCFERGREKDLSSWRGKGKECYRKKRFRLTLKRIQYGWGKTPSWTEEDGFASNGDVEKYTIANGGRKRRRREEGRKKIDLCLGKYIPIRTKKCRQ